MPDGSWTLSTAQLTGLNLIPATNFNGVLNLTVTATATENGSVSSSMAALPVTITGVADAPNLTVQAATGVEDHTIPLVNQQQLGYR